MTRKPTLAIAALLCALTLPFAGFADPATKAAGESFTPVPAAGIDLATLRWKKRPIVVFADTPSDPAFEEQLRALASVWPELRRRDVMVIADSDPTAMTAVRRKLRPHGFSLVIVAKDGQVAQRKPLPWSGSEIIAAIDRMPLRRDEIREQAKGRGPGA